MRPVCKTELGDKTEKPIQRSKFCFGHVATIGDGCDVVSCQVVACSPILGPVRDGGQTISSATTSKVRNRPIIVAVKLDHRHASRWTTYAVNEIVRRDSIRETHSIRVACLRIVGSRVGRKCIEHR